MKNYYNHLWAVIHITALNFDKDNSNETDYKAFYTSIGRTMPCQQCVEHYVKFVHDNPIDFEDLFGWTVNLHNSVNQTRGEAVFTREESLQYWRTSS
jgi:hypothetical protein